MKYKILFVRTVPYDFDVNTYNVQGFGLGKAFCKLGYDFDFLYFSKKGSSEYILDEIDGHRIKVIAKPRIRIFRTGICKEICDKDFLSQYDFVISCEYGQYMTYALSKASDNVVMYSGPYYNLFYLPFISPIYDFLFTKKINANIKYKFVKSILAEEFLRNKGYTGVHTVGVALDLERFNDSEKMSDETKKIVDYMNNNECLLFVGALSDRKNFPFLLEVYKKVLKKNPTIKFVIIGKGKEVYVNKYFSKLTKDERDGILHVNRIENAQLRFIYPKAKAFLLPSKLEIFGMVLLESMFLGAPVISSRNGGSLTLMSDGSTGQIVDKFDADLWVDAIEKYLTNPEYSKSVVKNAHERITNEYNWNSIAMKMLSIMEIE